MTPDKIAIPQNPFVTFVLQLCLWLLLNLGPAATAADQSTSYQFRALALL